MAKNIERMRTEELEEHFKVPTSRRRTTQPGTGSPTTRRTIDELLKAPDSEMSKTTTKVQTHEVDPTDYETEDRATTKGDSSIELNSEDIIPNSSESKKSTKLPVKAQLKLITTYLIRAQSTVAKGHSYVKKAEILTPSKKGDVRIRTLGLSTPKVGNAKIAVLLDVKADAILVRAEFISSKSKSTESKVFAKDALDNVDIEKSINSALKWVLTKLSPPRSVK
jgi:hypothetical protein